MKEKLYEIVDQLGEELDAISEYVFCHPELGNEEFESSKYLVETLRKHGFTVEYPYCGLETAFRAEYKCGEGKGPKVAFLPEYDALPGYGPNKNQNAHACGHNWIAANALGCAIALSKASDAFDGTIVVIGTPAEETTGGKCDLVDRGAFADIDAAIQMHLGSETIINVTTLAMDSLEFHYAGRAAHAACYPEDGINALDAVNLMFAGVNALRQHMKSDARVAGIITEGGAACNIVPDSATCRYYIRAKERSYLLQLTEKIINCAKGAALMTGAELSYHNFENSFDNLIYHEGLRASLRANLEALGVTGFADDNTEASGSSDIGNVSQVCPTVYCEIDAGAPENVYVHHEDMLPYVHGELAKDTLRKATKAMAATAAEVLKGEITC